jgi:hypothetical protein
MEEFPWQVVELGADYQRGIRTLESFTDARWYESGAQQSAQTLKLLGQVIQEMCLTRPFRTRQPLC